MKRLPILCLATVPFLPAAAVSAQHTISLLGGMNLTVIAQKATDDIVRVGFHRTTGLNVGLAGSFMLSPPETRHTLHVQLTGVYSQKGAELGRPGLDHQLDYLDLGLLADMRFRSVVDGVFIHFVLGPALGWLMSCQGVRAATDDNPGSTTACEEGKFRSLDYSIVGGSGVEFAFVDRLRVTTSFLYTIGLGYIDHGDEFEAGTMKNRTLTLRAGVGFPIG